MSNSIYVLIYVFRKILDNITLFILFISFGHTKDIQRYDKQ